ncbi:MAG TPA: Mur ligase family protein [Clostridia bacterium]|nr:Mur ligase family protein [Clostridia bacterium]
MSVDSMGSIGVTADPQKVRPGMIYVDLSGTRNRRQIYEAYSNGASLIFTPYNISDPELPVIKVRNPRDTFYMMVDRFLGKQGYHPQLIGVIGDVDKSVLIELIQCILYGKTDKEWMNNWNRSKTSLGNRHNLEDFFSAFTDLYKSGMNIIPIAIDTNAGRLFYSGNISLDCAILTDKGSIERNYKGHSIIDFLASSNEKKSIIMNNDENYGIKAAEESKEIRIITYGLNTKAVVTASSIDVDEITCFNYCVQRSFQTRSGKRIEPFEIPVHLNSLGGHNIYNALAAITCGLYYDEDIGRIKAAVESYKAPARHFQRIFDGDFTIIDNYCSSIHDYTEVFDSMQILSYENLIPIISVSQDANLSFHGEKARLITEWAGILKCREVILTSCMDGDFRVGELPIKSMRIYKRILKENGVSFRYYHLLQHAIERGLSLLNKRDLMIMLGGDEMNIAHKLLHRRLRPVSEQKS